MDPLLAAGGVRPEVKLLPAYLTGTYGSDVRTNISYIPLIFSLESARQELKITVPWISIHTEEPVAVYEGEIITRDEGLEPTESGLGDIVLREDVYFLQGTRTRPWIWGGVRVKFPTADESRGLGSGELDYGPSAGMIQPLGNAWHIVLTADHVIRGDPVPVDSTRSTGMPPRPSPGETEAIEFRNTTWLSAGVQAQPNPNDSVGAFYERRQSVFRGRAALEDVTLTWTHRFSPSLSLPVTVFYGLSETAEDWGVSVGISMR